MPASHRAAFREINRSLSIKQFPYDWAPPVYDHPRLWRNAKISPIETTTVPKAHFLGESLQAKLGQKLDRPQSSIARLESGQLGDTHFGFILDLAKALDMPAENLVAAAFGREMHLTGKTALDKSEILESIKRQLQEADPLTQKLIVDLFSQLTDCIKEVPKVPELKKGTLTPLAPA